MKQLQFENTIARLAADQYNAVSVVNMATLKPIVTNKLGYQIIEQYGSVEAFFNEIITPEISKVKILDRRKSGTAFVPAGEPYDFSIEIESEQILQHETKQAAPQVHQTVVPMPQNSGLNGMYGGLGIVEMENINRIIEFPKLEAKYNKLEAKAEMLEKENVKLERTIHELNTTGSHAVAKSEANNELMKIIAPLGQPLLERLLIPAAPAAPIIPGLSGAISPTLQNAIQILSESSEAEVQMVSKIMIGFDNEDFSNELLELMKKRQIL